MTLVQVLADETSVHMACDFRLTDACTGELVQDDAHKLVQVVGVDCSIVVGVTGVAVLAGTPIGQWMAERVAGPGRSSSLESVVEALRQAEPILASVMDASVRRHTFVIAGIVGTQSRIILLSNFETIVKGQIFRSSLAGSKLIESGVKPKGPVFFATGAAHAVRRQDRESATLLLRAQATDDRLQHKLNEINEAASQRSSAISAGCMTASLHASGRGSARPFLTPAQGGDFLPPEFEEFLKQLGLSLRPGIGPDGKPLALQVRGSTSVRVGGSHKYFTEQIKLRPRDAELWNNFGAFLDGARRHDEAISAFRRAIELQGDNRIALANLARITWLRLGDKEAAEELYLRAVGERHGVASWILSDFAVFLDGALGDYPRAEEFHEAATLRKDSPRALAARANFILARSGDLARARDLMREALRDGSQDYLVLTWAARMDWEHGGDAEAALNKLYQAVSINPPDPYPFAFTADLLLRQGDAATARTYYRIAMKKGDLGPETRGNYGLALLLLGKHPEALKVLSRALRSSPGDQAIRVNLAVALWCDGKKGEAVAQFRRLLSEGTSPQIELELCALLFASTASSDSHARAQVLIGEGVHADGSTLKCLARRRSGAERKELLRLAALIEGRGSQSTPS